MALYREHFAEDVAAASASVLCNLLPDFLNRKPQEIYQTLKAHVGTAIRAYCDSLQAWGLKPPLENATTVQIASLTELREKINSVHQLAGPELRKFIDTYDFPFSTMSAILAFGRRLVKDVIDAKELAAKLCERTETKAVNGEQGSEINRAGC